jgi:hypothetical protein
MFTKNYEELLQRYLKVCSQALEKHKDISPFKEVFRDAENLPGGGRTNVELYDDGKPVGAYQIGFFKGQVGMLSHIAEGKFFDDEKEYLWRVDAAELQKVVDDPQTHIDDPKKLDWDWVFARLMTATLGNDAGAGGGEQ